MNTAGPIEVLNVYQKRFVAALYTVCIPNPEILYYHIGLILGLFSYLFINCVFTKILYNTFYFVFLFLLLVCTLRCPGNLNSCTTQSHCHRKTQGGWEMVKAC